MLKPKQAKISVTLIAITSLFLCSAAFSASLQWKASTGEVKGYKVYYGTSSSSPSNKVDVGNATRYSLDSLSLSPKTQYYFSVSAYNQAGESRRCAPVAYTPADATPPAPPAGLQAY